MSNQTNELIDMKNVIYMKTSHDYFHSKVTTEHVATEDGKFAVYSNRQLIAETVIPKVDISDCMLEHIIFDNEEAVA